MTTLPQLKGSDILTHSRMQCFKTCRRKHYYRYILGLRRDVDGKPLRIGSAFHLGLDIFARTKDINEAIEGAVASYEELPGWCQTEEQVFEWLVERQIVVEMLYGYFKRWESEDYEIPGDIQVAEVLATEQVFKLPIINPETGARTPSFIFAGKIDKIVRLGDSRKAVTEHKTMGESLAPDSDYWTCLRIDSQISGYMHAARKLGHEVYTVLFDVARKPSIAPKTVHDLDDQGRKIVLDSDGERMFKQNGEPYLSVPKDSDGSFKSHVETPGEFGVRLREDIADRPDFYFARVEIPRLDADLAEFEQELWDQQKDMRSAELTGRHYRNTSACLHPYRCEYLDICHHSIDVTDTPTGFVRVDDLHPELVG